VLKLRGSTSGAVNVVAQQATPVNGTWYTISGIATLPAGSGVIACDIFSAYADGATANSKALECQYALSVNLTTAFGAGNEPTAANMNVSLAAYAVTSWFTGTATLTSNTNPLTLTVDCLLDPWFTTLRAGVIKPESWFAMNDKVYKQAAARPTSGAAALTYYTPAVDMGTSRHKKKTFREILTGKGGTCLVTPVVDGTDGTAITFELPAATGVSRQRISTTGYRHSHKIQNVDGDPIEVNQVELDYRTNLS
jgi:hypothetical protein